MDVTEGNHSLTVLVNQPSEGSTCRRIRSFNVDFTVESESGKTNVQPHSYNSTEAHIDMNRST